MRSFTEDELKHYAAPLTPRDGGPSLVSDIFLGRRLHCYGEVLRSMADLTINPALSPVPTVPAARSALAAPAPADIFTSSTAPAPVMPTAIAPPPEDLPPQWIVPFGEMVAAVAKNPDLNVALTPELRGKLVNAFTAMQQRGVRFSRERERWGSTTRAQLSPADAVAHLAGCRAHYLEKLIVQVPGHPDFEPQGAHEMAAVGQFVLGPPDALRGALRGLAGVGFEADELAGYCNAQGAGNLSIQFYRGGKQKFNSDNLETYCANSVDEVLAVNALAGDGRTQGLQDPRRMERIQAGIKQGWIERCGFGEAGLETYRKHQAAIPLTVEHGLPPLLAPEAAMDDVAAVAKAAAQYRDAYRKHLLPVVTSQGYRGTYAFHDTVRRIDGGLPFEAVLESFAILARAGGLGKDVQDLHRDLVAKCPSGAEATRRATILASHLEKKDLEGARRTLQGLEKMAPSPTAQLYDELRNATGSHVAAQAGVNLVRIPTWCSTTGAESLEERKGVYVRLAETLPESARDQTPEVYEELLIHRHADESLAKTADRFSMLLSSCSMTGCPMLAPVLFGMLQENPPEAVDERIVEFVQAVTVGRPLGEALVHLEPRVAQTVQVEETRVTIGGIVLNRRKP